MDETITYQIAKNFNSAAIPVSFAYHLLAYATHVLDASAAGRIESLPRLRQIVQGV